MTVGQSTETECTGCHNPFTYTYKGRRKLLCDPCRVARNKVAGAKASVSFRKTIRLAEGEAVGQSLAGVRAIARMSQEEAAVKLSVWEAMDKLLATGVLPDPEPISRSAIQQLERKVLNKIRRVCGPHIHELRTMGSSERGAQYSVSPELNPQDII